MSVKALRRITPAFLLLLTGMQCAGSAGEGTVTYHGVSVQHGLGQDPECLVFPQHEVITHELGAVRDAWVGLLPPEGAAAVSAKLAVTMFDNNGEQVVSTVKPIPQSSMIPPGQHDVFCGSPGGTLPIVWEDLWVIHLAWASGTVDHKTFTLAGVQILQKVHSRAEVTLRYRFEDENGEEIPLIDSDQLEGRVHFVIDYDLSAW